jgi:hypothetical protein
MVQELCRDIRLVEKVLQVAEECEMEYMHMVQDHGRGHPNSNPLRPRLQGHHMLEVFISPHLFFLAKFSCPLYLA